MDKTIKIGLIKGRHELPVHFYLFEEIEAADLIRPVYLYRLAVNRLIRLTADHVEYDQVYDAENDCDKTVPTTPNVKLHLYVTGLTVVLFAVLNAARRLDIPVVLYLFNRETGDYFQQEVL